MAVGQGINADHSTILRCHPENILQYRTFIPSFFLIYATFLVLALSVGAHKLLLYYCATGRNTVNSGLGWALKTVPACLAGTLVLRGFNEEYHFRSKSLSGYLCFCLSVWIPKKSWSTCQYLSSESYQSEHTLSQNANSHIAGALISHTDFQVVRMKENPMADLPVCISRFVS